MTETQEAPVSERRVRQRNMAGIPIEQDDHIQELVQKITLWTISRGFGKPKWGKLVADAAEVGLESLENILATNTGILESYRLARSEKNEELRKELEEGINKILREELDKFFLAKHLVEEKHG